MSHHSGFAFHAVDPQAPDLDRVLPSLAIAALVRRQGASPRPGARPRFIFGMTRSDWTKVAAKALMDAAGDFEALRFLSEEHETHREFVLGEWNSQEDGGLKYGQDLRITLFDPRTQLAVAAEIDRLIAWCASNVAAVVRGLEFDDEATVLQAIHHTPAQDSPTDLDEEGQGARCLFSLLKGVRQGLRQAQADGLCALYVNDQFTSQAWYRDHLSRPGLGADGTLHETRTLAEPPSPPRAMPAPASTGIPVDPARLRSMPRIARPGWVDGDDLERLFDAQDALLGDGQVVWAAAIQVNMLLLEPLPGMGGLPGEVLYDPAGRLSPQGLVEQARALFFCKGREDVDPERRAFGAYLASEVERAFGRRAPVDGGYPLLASTTYFARPALPDGWLAEMAFPVVVSPACPGLVLPLHHTLWPDELRAHWKELGARRQPVASAPVAAEPVDPGAAALDVAKQYLADVRNQDLIAARLWLEKAVAHGNAEAKLLLRDYELEEAPRTGGGWLARLFKRRG